MSNGWKGIFKYKICITGWPVSVPIGASTYYCANVMILISQAGLNKQIKGAIDDKKLILFKMLTIEIKILIQFL